MDDDIILVIDVGTTSARSMLFDRDFRMVATSSREYPNSYPGPFMVEQDPDVWWRAAMETSKESMERKPSGAAVAAVIVTSQRATVIPVDKNGRCLDGRRSSGRTTAASPSATGSAKPSGSRKSTSGPA